MDAGSIILVIGSIVSAMIGGSLVFLGQWFTSRQSAKVEAQKWKQEELREVRKDIVRFREARSKPIIEALDRAARSWDADSYFELAKMAGYEFESVDVTSEEYIKEDKERQKKYLNQLVDDISATGMIHDEDVRELVTNILWQSTNSDADEQYNQKLQDAYLKLEKWIFNPHVDYNSVQSRDK